MVAMVDRQQLTPMQRSVLHLALNGRSNEQIATELGVTAGTVKRHLSDIRDRLGVDGDESRRWLVRVAYALGIARGSVPKV